MLNGFYPKFGVVVVYREKSNDKNNYCSLRSFVIIIASIYAVFFLLMGCNIKDF